MRIGFCRVDDSMNRKSWSGIPHSMFTALERNCEAEIVPYGPLKNPLVLPFKAIRKLSVAVCQKEFQYRYFGPVAR